MKTNIPDKLTFKKREVINIARLDGKVLDYWEGQFDILHPVINQNGEKFFSRNDLEIILRIKELLIAEKKSREDARAILNEEFGMAMPPPPPAPAAPENNGAGKRKNLTSIRKGLREILTLLDKDVKK